MIYVRRISILRETSLTPLQIQLYPSAVRGSDLPVRNRLILCFLKRTLKKRNLHQSANSTLL